MNHQTGKRVQVIAESIQRSNGAVWKGAVGTIVNVTGDGYQVDFDGTVLDNVKDQDVMAV